MKRWLIYAAIAAIVACTSATAPTPPWPHAWHSQTWAYQYTTTGYSEGFDSVRGRLTFERADSTHVRLRSDSGVTAYFWTVTGADTAHVVGVIWPAGAIDEGLVTPGDSFTFIDAQYPVWAMDGTYTARGDTLRYSLLAQDSTTSFQLLVQFLKER